MIKCFNSACFNNGLKKCSKCRIALYCSEKCQYEDWKKHKEDCIDFIKKESLEGIKINIAGLSHTNPNICLTKKEGKEVLKNIMKSTGEDNKSKQRVMNAIALILEGKADKAERELRKALQLDGNNAEAYNTLGILYDKVGKYKIAKRLIERAMEIRPELREYKVNYARVIKKMEYIEKV
jgi:tetratricopeptide (TPR) repeat protein